MTPPVAPHARRARIALALAVIPLLGACAAVPNTSGSIVPIDQPDRVVWVRARDANATRVVLSGAPVQLMHARRERAGDTLVVRLPFAVVVPDGAFEVAIRAYATTPGLRGSAPAAQVEFVTTRAGNIASVRGEGARLVIRREAVGQPLSLSGALRMEARPVGSLGDR